MLNWEILFVCCYLIKLNDKFFQFVGFYIFKLCGCMVCVIKICLFGGDYRY